MCVCVYQSLYGVLNDFGNGEVVELVVLAQLFNDQGLPHCRWAQHTQP